MDWHLYAEFTLRAGAQDQDAGAVEVGLISLAGLGFAPEMLARISAALQSCLGARDKSTVRVWVAGARPPRPTFHYWRFFIVTPGSPAGDQPAPALELYLY